MKYSQKYPLAKIDDQPLFEDVFQGAKSGPCTICGDLTTWVNLSFQAYICSEECEGTMWAQFRASKSVDAS